MVTPVPLPSAPHCWVQSIRESHRHGGGTLIVIVVTTSSCHADAVSDPFARMEPAPSLREAGALPDSAMRFRRRSLVNVTSGVKCWSAA